MRFSSSSAGNAKGSATGAMNFLVFVMTALAGPVIGWWMQKLAGSAALTEDVFVTAGSAYVAAIVVAAFLTLFLKETGGPFARRIVSMPVR